LLDGKRSNAGVPKTVTLRGLELETGQRSWAERTYLRHAGSV